MVLVCSASVGGPGGGPVVVCGAVGAWWCPPRCQGLLPGSGAAGPARYGSRSRRPVRRRRPPAGALQSHDSEAGGTRATRRVALTRRRRAAHRSDPVGVGCRQHVVPAGLQGPPRRRKDVGGRAPRRSRSALPGDRNVSRETPHHAGLAGQRKRVPSGSDPCNYGEKVRVGCPSATAAGAGRRRRNRPAAVAAGGSHGCSFGVDDRTVGPRVIDHHSAVPDSSTWVGSARRPGCVSPLVDESPQVPPRAALR